ncbi:class I SAM-dependent methyltransferase [Amaricoccus macauensis]|uniref:class I SAM-dependent methyltransferase n=1 Tax=Amaricoccus macauensis TaxID=57001 RepID=UPI003C7CD447
MHQDVLDLRAFYYRTRLGRSTQRALQEALRAFWPDVHGLRLAGFGFAAPLLRPFLGEAERVISLMPAQQGVMPWPSGAPNVSALVEETHWPLAAGSIDRLIVAHGFETSEHPVDLLAEIWRVLAPGGQAVFVVPNRAGLWARRDITPFGNGRPYTVGQLEAQLEKHRFCPMRDAAALYWPPTHRKFWHRTAGLWERMGRRYDPRLIAGALLLEAGKQVYARPNGGSPSVLPGALEVLEGLRGKPPKPASSLTSAKLARERPVVPSTCRSRN